METKTIAELIKDREYKRSQGSWVPACNGTEIPFKTRNRFTLLYCWQSSTGKHAYLNVETDLILSDEEAHMAMWGNDSQWHALYGGRKNP